MSDRVLHLPEEMVMEIVLSLPSKSLIRFKSVCKPWCSLFSSSRFMADHLLPERDDDEDLLLVSHFLKPSAEYVVSLLSNRTLAKLEHSRTLPLPQYPDPFRPLINILGCCNDLMCIYYYKGALRPVALWSLTTGDVKFLPPSDVPGRPGATYWDTPELGFGYDATSQDYKVILITQEHTDMYEPFRLKKIEIYSYNSDSWRGVVCDDELPANISGASHPLSTTYTNGIFSWLALHHVNYDPNWMIWFRMSDDSFGIHMLPPNRFKSELRRYFDELVELNGRIALVTFYEMPEEPSLRVWVLLEFGAEDSWTPLFTLGPIVGIGRALWFWNNGKMIIENTDGDLLLCDPFSQEIIKPLNIGGYI